MWPPVSDCRFPCRFIPVAGSTPNHVRLPTKYQQAQNEIENLRRNVQQGTANDYRGVLTSISEINAYGQSVESARTSLAATEAGYQVGTRTIVDALNAQIQVFSAMANFLNARYSYLTNYLKLKADTGQLSLEDIKAVNAQLVPGKINALIAPLMNGEQESQKSQQQMIERVIQRAAKTVGPMRQINRHKISADPVSKPNTHA